MGVEENKKRLAEAMDELADRHILEAMDYNLIQKRKRNTMKKQLAIAAGAFLVLGFIGLVKLTPSIQQNPADTTSSQTFEVKHTSTEAQELTESTKPVEGIPTQEATESTQSSEVIPIQEKGEIVLPSLGENERLVVQNGENLTVLDKYGKICNQFESATIYTKLEGPSFKWMGNMLLVSLENPLPIQIEMDNEEYKVGLYSLEQNDWIIEPIYECLNLLSNTVFTTSELLRSTGNLMKTDGTLIFENVGYCSVTRDYIMTTCSKEYSQPTSASKEQATTIGLIFDLQGNYLSSYDTINYIHVAWDDKIIMQNGQSGQTYLQDGYGKVSWTVDWQQWRFWSRCGAYLSWYTAGEEPTGVITDWQLNEVMNDEQFFQLNADVVHSGRELKIVALEDGDTFSWEGGDTLIVSIINEAGTTEYYRCDSNFRVLEMCDVDPATISINSPALDEITYSWGENAAEKFLWTEGESNIYIEDLQEKVSFTLAK